MKKQALVFALFLILAAAVTRVLRHAGLVDLPPNVAPIAALGMFGGAYLPKKLALALPLAAMVLSDLTIGFYEWQIVASVYLGFLVSVGLGFWLRSRRSLAKVVGASLTGSLIFFFVTNAAVWAFDAHGLYPHTMTGLVDAYVAGIPFFRNTLIGDLGFVALMFGSMELVTRMVTRPKLAEETKRII